MTIPTLSITIPTYNRRKFLQATLEALLPQITDDVEVVIFDNCSTDDTAEYLRALGERITYICQDSNIGPDRNMYACFTQARGEYIWLLCDDDLPCSTAVQRILEGTRAVPKPPLLSLRVIAGDINLSNYDPSPVETGWTSFDRNAFLADISFMLTFAPLIVVRRDCLDSEFVRQSIGTNLVPAAVVLSTVGTYNQALRPDKPLLFGRGDNVGGYDAFIVFGKNLVKLFNRCNRKWFDRRAVASAYNDNIAMVLNPAMRRALQAGPFPWRRLATLVHYTYRFSYFYSNLLPALLWQVTKRYILRRT